MTKYKRLAMKTLLRGMCWVCPFLILRSFIPNGHVLDDMLGAFEASSIGRCFFWAYMLMLVSTLILLHRLMHETERRKEELAVSAPPLLPEPEQTGA